jgi:hypothetical protein
LGVGCVCVRLGKSDKVRLHKYFAECSLVPLTERAEFKTVLQRCNSLQVPKLVRWKYKLESTQTLKVPVWDRSVIGGWETF